MITDDNKLGSETPDAAPSASEAPEMLDRVVQSAHDTIDRLAEQAAPHVQRLAEGLESAGDAVQERADSLLQTGDEWAETLRDSVRANPLAAIAAAVAVGLIFARLTR